MKIDRVTITGADDNTDPSKLVELSNKYPFVEWAILLSRSSEGKKARYPSRNWMRRLQRSGLVVAGHLCGTWVRELVHDGNCTVAIERPEYMEMFPRIQLNFHGAIFHHPHRGFWQYLQEHPIQYIFQMDGENDSLLLSALNKRINAVPFFDRSGGDGITPENWPEPYSGLYNGYAGGIGPDNINQELEKIAQIVDDKPIWIDMESKVRNDEDEFDLEKVTVCLEAAKKWL